MEKMEVTLRKREWRMYIARTVGCIIVNGC